MSAFDAVTDERHRVANLLEGLTPQQWATPSCCGQWTVQQVVGHLLVGPIKGVKGSLPFMLKALGRPNKTNDLAARDLAKMGPEQLVAELRRNASNEFVPPGFPQDASLIDVTIHGRDIVVPLGLELDVPVQRWLPALKSASSGRYGLVNAKGKLKGLSFGCTDLDFRWGDGPEVTGPAAALAHAMWGRACALPDLSGDGVATLTGRLG